MWLNLYTTRLVLANLGVEDMGVYGVVGSVVSLFAVLSSGITNTIQRFIAYEIGKENGDVNKVFCSSLNIIILLSFLIALILESIGLWFLYNRVNIPASSIQAAFWVYQLSVLTCIVNLINIPYNALVIAHEKMDAYALISILQVVMTCVTVYCLSFFASQRLILYASFLTIISVLVLGGYQIYCRIKFQESRYRLLIDKNSMKEIGKFAGVSTTSGILESIYNQGVVLVINWSFGVALNAVYTIALQLKNSVLSFAYNIFRAISPQITKTYAAGNIETHKKLVYTGCKLQVYMLFFVMIPFLFRTDLIMRVWLGNVPPYMVSFAQIIIFLCLLYAIFEPIRSAVLCTNSISKFMIIPNVFYILSLPICYWLALLSQNPVVLIMSVVVMDVLGCILRTYYALLVTPLLLKEILYQVLLPIMKVALGGIIVCCGISYILENSLMGLLLLLVVHSIMLSVIIYLVGINIQERQFVKGAYKNIVAKISQK